MNMSNKVNLKELFNGLQNQMIAQLNTNRDFINHPSSKGDSLENTWIDWLRKYLPNRYCEDKAIIIDCTGQLSDQIDLVIYAQQYTPFVLTQNGVLTSTNEIKKVNTIEKHLKALTGLKTIDMGCAATYGSFYVDYEGQEKSDEKDLEKRNNDYYFSLWRH